MYPDIFYFLSGCFFLGGGVVVFNILEKWGFSSTPVGGYKTVQRGELELCSTSRKYKKV